MKHKMGVAIFFALFLTTNTGYGIEIIKGVIEDAEGKPVSGAEVSITGSACCKAITNEDGGFAMSCIEGTTAFQFDSPHIPDWCWSRGGYAHTVIKHRYAGGWDFGQIKLHGVLIKSDNRIKWIFKTDKFAFIDNMDGTVTDLKSGLMWAKESPKDSVGCMDGWTWQRAEEYCDELKLADYADWRLPSLAELETLPADVIFEGPIYTLNSWWSSELAKENKVWILSRGRHSPVARTGNNVVLPVRSVIK